MSLRRSARLQRRRAAEPLPEAEQDSAPPIADADEAAPQLRSIAQALYHMTDSTPELHRHATNFIQTVVKHPRELRHIVCILDLLSMFYRRWGYAEPVPEEDFWWWRRTAPQLMGLEASASASAAVTTTNSTASSGQHNVGSYYSSDILECAAQVRTQQGVRGLLPQYTAATMAVLSRGTDGVPTDEAGVDAAWHVVKHMFGMALAHVERVSPGTVAQTLFHLSSVMQHIRCEEGAWPPPEGNIAGGQEYSQPLSEVQTMLEEYSLEFVDRAQAARDLQVPLGLLCLGMMAEERAEQLIRWAQQFRTAAKARIAEATAVVAVEEAASVTQQQPPGATPTNDRPEVSSTKTAAAPRVSQRARGRGRRRRTSLTPAAWQDLADHLLRLVVMSEDGHTPIIRLWGRDLVSAAAVSQSWRAALHWETFSECPAWSGVLPRALTWRLLVTVPRHLLELNSGSVTWAHDSLDGAGEDEAAIYRDMGVDRAMHDELLCDNQVALFALTTACPNLSSLFLSGRVHPTTMLSLSRFGNLRSMTMNYVRCQWTGVFRTATAGWSKLQRINFGRNFVDDEALQSLATHCPELRFLLADRCGSAVSDEGVVELAKGCRALWHLELPKADLTDRSMRALAEHCKELRWLDLNGCRHVSDEGLRAFQLPSSSHQSVLGGDAKKSRAAAASKACDTLSTVSAPCPHMQSLDLSCTRVTANGVHEFQRLMGDAGIQHEIEVEFETILSSDDDY
jgi:hypothetical protein